MGWFTRFRAMNRMVRYHTVTRNKKISDLKGPNRKSFGLLDAPSIPINLSYHVKTYRIWFRSGPMPVGKSATIHRLTGQFIHSEMKPTTGAQVSLVYWPGKCAVTQQEMIMDL